MMKNDNLSSLIEQFESYKVLGEKALGQIPDEKLDWQYNETCNSAITLVKHMQGHMLSRWTDFLDSDGEKAWRNRDAEFENDIQSRQELFQRWQQGWATLLRTLTSLEEEDLVKMVHVHHRRYLVQDVINRQLAHYAYHVGQIVMLGKMLTTDWNPLSAP